MKARASAIGQPPIAPDLQEGRRAVALAVRLVPKVDDGRAAGFEGVGEEPSVTAPPEDLGAEEHDVRGRFGAGGEGVERGADVGGVEVIGVASK